MHDQRDKIYLFIYFLRSQKRNSERKIFPKCIYINFHSYSDKNINMNVLVLYYICMV